MNDDINSRDTTNKLISCLKRRLHPINIPGMLMSIAAIVLLVAFFYFEKEQYQLVAFFVVLIFFFAQGLTGLLILIYKKYSFGNKILTGRKAYLLAGFSLLTGWGILAGILVWMFWNR